MLMLLVKMLRMSRHELLVVSLSFHTSCFITGVWGDGGQTLFRSRSHSSFASVWQLAFIVRDLASACIRLFTLSFFSTVS